MSRARLGYNEPMENLIYIVLAMIVYDFSIHLIFLLKKQDFFLDRGLNYWPEWKDDKNATVYYQRFWTAYWGLAWVLLILYLVSDKA